MLDRRKAAHFLSQAPWLLRLGQTDAIDVQIAGQVLRKYERWAEIEALLDKVTVTGTAVPEPAQGALLAGIGLAAAYGCRRPRARPS